MSVYRWCNNFRKHVVVLSAGARFFGLIISTILQSDVYYVVPFKRKLFKSTIMPVEVLISIVKIDMNDLFLALCIYYQTIRSDVRA